MLALAFAALLGCFAAASFQLQPPSDQTLVADADFEPGESSPSTLQFGVTGRNWSWSASDERAHSGTRSAKLVCEGESDAPFGNLICSLPAETLRGRKVRLSARVWVDGPGRAQMWLRVDRPGQRVGGFDNMDDRPMSGASWHDASIEVTVDQDAEAVVLGFISFERSTLFVDDVRLVLVGAARPLQAATSAEPLTPRELENVCAAARLLAYVRYFHPSDAVAGMRAWDHFAVQLFETAAPARDASELADLLARTFEPFVPGLQVWAGRLDAAPPLTAPAASARIAQWHHRGVGLRATPANGGIYSSKVRRVIRREDAPLRGLELELPGGVAFRLAMDLPVDVSRTLPPSQTPQAWSAPDALHQFNPLNRWTRLTSAALVWGVMQHFYPYFDVVGTDWNAELSPLLARAASDATPEASDATLEALVAKLHDGHGSVASGADANAAVLPFAARWLGEQLTITSVAPSAAAVLRAGDVVLAIDDTPSEQVHQQLSASVSAATDGWRRHMTAHLLPFRWPTEKDVELSLRGVDGALRTVTVARVLGERAPETPRPENGVELAPGIVYMNLHGADDAVLAKATAALESARGIVLDLRGYPNSAAMTVIRHLAKEKLQSAHFEIPSITAPDRNGWDWSDAGRWNLAPLEPHWQAQVAWLTDESAISYAESIMGIVEAHDLGLIVGGTTAGTNGNINPFQLPTGHSVSWTGMRVRKHDGSRHHGVGIAPDIACTPTPAGIAAGRDEVLERAVDELRKRLTK